MEHYLLAPKRLGALEYWSWLPFVCGLQPTTNQLEFVLIGCKQRLLNSTANPTARIKQFPIKQVLTVKSLIVHIDENLT